MCGGATDDYYWTFWGINISYTLELDPDLHSHEIGFHLPPEKIRPVGKKVFNALRLIAEKMDKEYPHLNS